jgi:hypothetical protein
MEERTGWRGAFGTAWGNLTGVNNEGNVRLIRLVFFVIFLLGTAWAGWSYLQGMELVELEEYAPTPRPSQAAADRQRLDTMIAQVEAASNLRRGSPESVRVVEENFARYPFAEPLPEGVVVLVPGEPFELPLPPPPPPPPPPYIELRGIMVMGNQHVAVMNIPELQLFGMIVRVGDTFMQRRGRIVRIAPDRVVVNWDGRNYNIAPSF